MKRAKETRCVTWVLQESRQLSLGIVASSETQCPHALGHFSWAVHSAMPRNTEKSPQDCNSKPPYHTLHLPGFSCPLPLCVLQFHWEKLLSLPQVHGAKLNAGLHAYVNEDRLLTSSSYTQGPSTIIIEERNVILVSWEITTQIFIKERRKAEKSIWRNANGAIIVKVSFKLFFHQIPLT